MYQIKLALRTHHCRGWTSEGCQVRYNRSKCRTCPHCPISNSLTQVGKMVRDAEGHFGPTNILINNAGIMYYTHMSSLNEAYWNEQIELNCKGTMNCIGAVLNGMVERKSGHIVNMSSDAGKRVC
jgi:short-subunit dehydrogenase